MSNPTVDRIVRPTEAENLTGYCDVHLRRLEARGAFPKRFKLAENSGPYGAVGWRLSSIQKWIEKRAATVVAAVIAVVALLIAPIAQALHWLA